MSTGAAIAWAACAVIAGLYVTLDLTLERRAGLPFRWWYVVVRAAICSLGPMGLAFYLGTYFGATGAMRNARKLDRLRAELEAERRARQ